MTVVTQDLRAKMVRDDLLDLETRSSYLSDLWPDVGDALGMGQQLDMGFLTDTLAAEDFVDSNFANTNLTVSTISYGNDNLIVDQARAIAREIPTFDDIFTLGGKWVDKVSPKVLKKLKNDRDTKDVKYLYGTVAHETAAVVDQVYHVNAAGDTITRGMIGTAGAMMGNIEGVEFTDLVWMINPWMSESIKLLGDWRINLDRPPERIGLGLIGWLNEVPVYASQSIPQVQVGTATGVTVSGGNAVFAFPAAQRNHGFVIGQKIWTTIATAGAGGWVAGSNIPRAVPLAITAVAADQSTVTVAYAGTGVTDATVVLTITCDASPNMLVNRAYLGQATIKYRMGARVIPYGRERITDVLQAWTIWGRKAHAGAVIVVHAPKRVAAAA
jgi:hypothetical protein